VRRAYSVVNFELCSREWGGGGFYLSLKNISVSSRILHGKTVVFRVYVYAIENIKTTNGRVGFEAAEGSFILRICKK